MATPAANPSPWAPAAAAAGLRPDEVGSLAGHALAFSPTGGTSGHCRCCGAAGVRADTCGRPHHPCGRGAAGGGQCLGATFSRRSTSVAATAAPGPQSRGDMPRLAAPSPVSPAAQATEATALQPVPSRTDVIAPELAFRLLASARGTTMVHVPKALRSTLAELLRHRAGPDPLRISGVLAGVLADASLTAVRMRVARTDPEAILTFASPGPRRPPSGAGAWRTKALTLMREGLVSRALRCLGQDGAGAATAAPLSGLGRLRGQLTAMFPPATRRLAGLPQPLPAAAQPLHADVEPQRPCMSRVRAAVAGPDDEAWTETVRRAVFRARQRTAPGPTGARHEHLAEPMRAPGGAAFARMIAEAVDATLAGDADATLLEGRLVPLAKPSAPGSTGLAKLRPIVIGDTMLAVAKRVASAPLRAAAHPLFKGSAQHLEDRNGCAVVARRVAHAHDQGWWVISLDVANAFNTVDRAAVMDAANTACPQVAAFVRWCLQPARVHLAPDVEPITCETGVVQGCPLAPTLFALALRGARERARSGPPGVPRDGAPMPTAVLLESLPDGLPAACRTGTMPSPATVYDAWYADDGHLVAPSLMTAAEVVDRLTKALQDIGLALNGAKTRVLPPPDVTLEAAEAELQRLGADGGGGGLAAAQATSMLVVLGTPVGDPAEVRAHVERLVDDACRRIAGYRALDAPFAELRALRWAGARSLLEHIALQVSAAAFDNVLHQRLEDVEVGAIRHMLRHYGTVPDADLEPAIRQARLPVHLGGLGVASLRSALVADTTRPGFVRLRSTAEQGAADGAASEAHLAGLDREPDRLEHLARYRELAADNGQAIRWIADNNPFVIDPRRDPNVEAAALALLLGRPVLEGIHPATPCTRGCRRAQGDGTSTVPSLDPLGRHILACSSLSTTRRHDAVRDALFVRLTAWFGRNRVHREAGIDVAGNPITRGAGQQRSGDMYPGDVYVDLGQQGRIFLDVVVRDTWSSAIVAKAATRGTAAAEVGYDSKTEDPKKRAMAQRLAELGARFQPIALGAFGGISYHALRWLREAAKAHEGGMVPNAMPVHQLRNGEAPLWKQAACDLSMAVVMTHAAAATQTREYLRGTSSAPLTAWPPVPAAEPVARRSAHPPATEPAATAATGRPAAGARRAQPLPKPPAAAMTVRGNARRGGTRAHGGRRRRRAARRRRVASSTDTEDAQTTTSESSDSESSSRTTSSSESAASTSEALGHTRRPQARQRANGRPADCSAGRATGRELPEDGGRTPMTPSQPRIGGAARGVLGRRRAAVLEEERCGQTNQQRCSGTFRNVANSPAARVASSGEAGHLRGAEVRPPGSLPGGAERCPRERIAIGVT